MVLDLLAAWGLWAYLVNTWFLVRAFLLPLITTTTKKRNRQQSRRKRKDYAGVRSVRVCRSFRVRECQNAMAASNGPGAFAHQPAQGERPHPSDLLGVPEQSPASLPMDCLASFPDASDGRASLIPYQYVGDVCLPHSWIHAQFLNMRESPVPRSPDDLQG